MLQKHHFSGYSRDRRVSFPLLFLEETRMYSTAEERENEDHRPAAARMTYQEICLGYIANYGAHNRCH
jgi:hypothetical protein